DPARINPLVPCELVIDHSVQVDDSGNPLAFANNTKLEYERNQERYTFLRWGQSAFRNFKVVPPETGIVHQVNIEYLARVEFYGDGLAELPLADRATIANMAPEYGATCGIFPVDAETLRYLKQTGRPAELVALVEAYFKEQGLFFAPGAAEAHYSDVLELDLATVVPSLAGPTRPQDRVALTDVKKSFHEALPKLKAAAKPKVAPLPLAGPVLGPEATP